MTLASGTGFAQRLQRNQLSDRVDRPWAGRRGLGMWCEPTSSNQDHLLKRSASAAMRVDAQRLRAAWEVLKAFRRPR